MDTVLLVVEWIIVIALVVSVVGLVVSLLLGLVQRLRRSDRD